MESLQLVIGVDGGGTSTRLVLQDLEGRERARVKGGPTLVVDGSEAAVAQTLATLLAEALEVAGYPPSAGDAPPIVAMVAGLAGVADPARREALLGHLHALGLAQQIEVVNDTRVAFAHAFGDRPGILLIAGTGSHALARTPNGRWVRKGGWGLLLGDEGSAWAIALRGIRLAIRAAERRGTPTKLTEWAAHTLGSPDPGDWARWVGRATKGEVAALAPEVVAVADGGDTVARILVATAVEDLVDHVFPMLSEFEEDGAREYPKLALLGGLIGPGGALRTRLIEILEELAVHIVPEPPDGALGGCALALELHRTGQISS
jgi:N-acetylglucosamine kinase-like BadF-type ATPase